MSGIVGDDGLTNEERNQCRESFEKFDKDNSGAISDWELKAMLQCKRAFFQYASAVLCHPGSPCKITELPSLCASSNGSRPDR